jgi:asparagine synthase (glutamine-hydrolysing)
VRLKIIDLTGGDQPVVTEDGRSAIAFNGEIYNHLAIRAELEARGHRFRSQCDTETVLHAFLEWDTGCFERLRGMFAVALWSEVDQRLVLARDRSGIKPLYFAEVGRNIYFGSELKAILEHPRVPRQLDLEALGYFLALNYVPGPHTLLRGIDKLPPGHFLEWRDGEVRIEEWWRLRSEPFRGTEDDAAAQLDGLIRDSVREQMVSDVPLGLWASGGVDSSTILHYAATQSSDRLKTFSIGFGGRSFDESRYFRLVADIYGTDHHDFDLQPDTDLLNTVEEFAYYSDEPSADAGALPVWYLSKMCRQHVTVALSGEGADELFGGYLTHRADLLARRARMVPAAIRRTMLAAAERYWPVSDEKIGLDYKVKRFLRGSLMHPDEAHFFWNGTFCAEGRRLICPGAPTVRMQHLVDRLECTGAGTLDRYLLTDQAYYLPDDILYKTDRMSMAHSVEIRPPFLDHRIIEFAAGLPANFKIRGSRQKYLLKKLMRGKLPDLVLDRAKTGFDIPAHDWFRGVLRPLLEDTLTDGALASAAIFDAKAVRSLIRDHMERRMNVGYHLWGLLTLFLWMKKWNVEVPPHAEVRRKERARAFATS